MSTEVQLHDGLPQIGEPTPWVVRSVTHQEGITAVRMEYRFEAPCDEGDVHEQMLMLEMLVQPDGLILPGDVMHVTLSRAAD